MTGAPQLSARARERGSQTDVEEVRHRRHHEFQWSRSSCVGKVTAASESVCREDGTVTVDLSGRSLIAVIDALWNGREGEDVIRIVVDDRKHGSADHSEGETSQAYRRVTCCQTRHQGPRSLWRKGLPMPPYDGQGAGWVVSGGKASGQVSRLSRADVSRVPALAAPSVRLIVPCRFGRLTGTGPGRYRPGTDMGPTGET